jgi:hypothetical protein
MSSPVSDIGRTTSADMDGGGRRRRRVVDETAASGRTAPSISWLAAAGRFLFGYDIFISYARVDATPYSARLARLLAREGFTVYLDQLGSTPGLKLPPAVLGSLRNSRALVLLGTPGAAASVAVGEELRLFVARQGIVIPIDIDGSCRTAPWAGTIAGLALTCETAGALVQGEVAPAVRDRIIDSCTFTRRNQRMRRVFFTTLGTTVALLGLAGLVLWLLVSAARRDVRRSQAATIRAESATRLESSAGTVVAGFREGAGQLEALRQARLLTGDLRGLLDGGPPPTPDGYPTVRPVAVLQELLEAIREQRRIPLPWPVLAADVTSGGHLVAVLEQRPGQSPQVRLIDPSLPPPVARAQTGGGGDAHNVKVVALDLPPDLRGEARPSIELAPAGSGKRYLVQTQAATILAGPRGQLARWPPAAHAFHPTEPRLALCQPGAAAVQAIDLDGRRVGHYPFRSGACQALAFSPDGRELARAGDGDRIEVWHADGRPPQLRRFVPSVSGLAESGGMVNRLLFTRQDLVAQASSGHLCVWSAAAEAPRRWQGFGLMEGALAAPRQGPPVVGFVDGQQAAHVRSVLSDEDELTFPTTGPIAFDDAGQLVAGVQGNSVVVRDLGGRRRFALTGHRPPIHRLRFAGSEKLVTVDAAAVRVWDLSPRVQRQTRPTAPGGDGKSASFARAAGTTLRAQVDSDQVRVWDAQGRLLASIDLPPSQLPYERVAFTGDGRSVVVSQGADQLEWRLGIFDLGGLEARADAWLAAAGAWQGTP